ncbi:hypothetical protein ACN38_g7817 [Penicillium nordicum]|uniref:Uncharacterized protein n=1 Tax=Penicillium nordicum TaxID=229535 RepID=A0A0M9WEA3_9EURO|nr:hypothetical protein ACN38_g7817 [Penicillium nordicum]
MTQKVPRLGLNRVHGYYKLKNQLCIQPWKDLNIHLVCTSPSRIQPSLTSLQFQHHTFTPTIGTIGTTG